MQSAVHNSNGSSLATMPAVDSKTLILRLYQIGIAACQTENEEKVRRVLSELTSALNFDCGEIAHSFYRMYKLCFRMLADGRFDQVLEIFDGLRSAWEEMMLATEGSQRFDYQKEFEDGN